jgi:hypothetical protein
MKKYTVELLNNIVKRDGATLLDNYLNIHCNTVIKFMCCCGKNDEKSFKRCNLNAMTCKLCTKENGFKKGKDTIESRLTPKDKEEIQLKYEISKKETCEEIKLREWRDNLVASKIIMDNIQYPHLILTDYIANTNGEIINTLTNKTLIGTSYGDGRITITIKKRKYQKHRFIMECLYNTVIPKQYDIDHINRDPANNTYKNLQILTRKEHCQKTANDNPNRGKKTGVLYSKKLIRTKYGNNGIVIEQTEFASIREACSVLKITKRPIQRSIDTGKCDRNQYFWNEVDTDQNDLIGEEWREHNNFKGLKISNKGRVHFTYLPKKYKSFGSCGLEGYRSIHYMGTKVQIHHLVCLVFNGNPPTEDHTVDHIDNDNTNNNAENLRWATKKEQSINRTNIRPIEVYNKLTQETIATYETQQDVCKAYSVAASVVSNILGFGIKHFERGSQLGCYKNLSVRYADLTRSEKIEREKAILDYEINVLRTDKNKRKDNKDNLPPHILKRTTHQYALRITFRGEKYAITSRNLEELITSKEVWIQTQRSKYHKIIDNII